MRSHKYGVYSNQSWGKYKSFVICSSFVHFCGTLTPVSSQRIALKGVEPAHPCRDPELSDGFLFRVRFDVEDRRAVPCIQAFHQQPRAAPPEEAFAVGLLANIGRLALATMFPDGYSSLLEQAKEGAADLIELEHQVLVMTHNEVSAVLLHDWGLPKFFTEPVFYSEQPELGNFVEGSRPYMLAWSLMLANHIADICLAEENARRAMMPSLMLLGSRLLIDAETLYPMCDKVVEEWRAWAAELDVESCAGNATDQTDVLPACIDQTVLIGKVRIHVACQGDGGVSWERNDDKCQKNTFRCEI